MSTISRMTVWDRESYARHPRTNPSYNCDDGPLAMPEHIKIGSQGTDCGGGHDYTITRYAHQVDEYAIWLEAQLKLENIEIMLELEKIFILIQELPEKPEKTNDKDPHSVDLITAMHDAPTRLWFTHAHVIRDTIAKLAGDTEPG